MFRIGKECRKIKGHISHHTSNLCLHIHIAEKKFHTDWSTLTFRIIIEEKRPPLDLIIT